MRIFLRKWGLFSTLLVLALAPKAALAQEVPGFISGLTELVVDALLPLLGKLLVALVAILIKISQYSDFVNSLAVVNGWVIVRDVANMFFIIVLLIIAFGTILGQEDYHYKKLLPKLLIMAVLVNFSRTIVGVMTDAAQVVMLTFVNGYSAAAGGNFANIFQINNLLTYSQDNCVGQAVGIDTNMVFIGALLALALTVVSLITIAVILAVLALRVVMLWILTILSPIAFLTGTFPQGQKYYQQWWEEFKNQAVVGPMLAFFLWLSLATLGSGEVVKEFTGGGAIIPTGESDFPAVTCTGAGGGDVLFSYIISIMMLMAGVQMAQQMGGAISGIAARAKGAATRALKMGAKALVAPAAFGVGMGLKRAQRAIIDWSAQEKAGLGRKLIGAAVSPGQAVAGFLQRGKGLDEEAKQRLYASWQEEADFMFTGGLWGKQAVRTPWLRLTRDTQRAHKLQTLKSLRRQDQVAVGNRLVGRKDIAGSTEYADAREAMWDAMAASGYNDDMALEFQPALIAYAKMIGHNVAPGENPWHDDILVSDFAYAYIPGFDVNNPEEIAKARGHVLDNIDNEQSMMSAFAFNEDSAKATGHPEQLGLGGEADPKTGFFKGVKKEGWRARYNEEKEDWEYEHISKEFDGVIHHGNQRFVDSTERPGYKAYKDQKSGKEFYHVKWNEEEGAYIDDQGWRVQYRHPEQEKFVMNEADKFSGQQIMGIRVHGIQSFAVDDQGKPMYSGQKTIQERRLTRLMKVTGEARRMEERPINALFENVTIPQDKLANDSAEVIAEDAIALRRLIEEVRAQPIALAMKLAKKEGLEERASVKDWGVKGITIKLRQPNGSAKEVMVHTWKPPVGEKPPKGGEKSGGSGGKGGKGGKGGGGGEEGGGGKATLGTESSGAREIDLEAVERAAAAGAAAGVARGGGGGGGTTVNVNVQTAALNAAVQSAIQSALSQFNALKIDAPTGDLGAREAAVIKNQFDSMREAIEKSGRTVDKRITNMFDEMDRLGHQSREFSDYFRRTFRKEDWDNLKKQFE